MRKLLEFRNVTIKINDRFLYKDVSFTINEGDRFVFFGPNGIGKSLLLELIALGFCNDVANRYKGLYVEGEILNECGENILDPGVHRKIAYAHQMEDFYTNTTVKQEAETSCAGVNADFDELELDRLLSIFHLEDKKNKRIKRNLSYGEEKLVHLICVVLKLKATNLLLLDEPLNHLSFKNSQLFNAVMNDEIRRNPSLTVIMVSHCRAMDFTEKALIYDAENKMLLSGEYVAYNCFSDELGEKLGCTKC